LAEKDWLTQCNACGGRCCNYIALEIDKPTKKADYDNIRWYLMHQDVNVFIDQENAWTVQFESKCRNQDEKNHCKIYNTKPKICSDYPGENNCEFEGEGKPYKVLFRTVKELEDYLIKKKKK